MSVYIDRKFLGFISSKLEQFKQKQTDLYNFRCPYCGDSKKNKLKARGYVYRKSNDYFFVCHNCGKSTTSAKFLEDIDGTTYKQYILERDSTGETGYGTNVKKPDFEQLKWPLFNGFQREQAVASRKGSLDVAEANAADARREVQASLTTQFAALRAAQVKIDITRASVEAANEDLRVVNERYRVGAATILDILNSQQALAQADVDAISARFDYLKAKAQIETLIGRNL